MAANAAVQRPRAARPRRRVTVRCSCLLADDLVVLGVSTNPEPRDAVRNIDPQRAIVKAHTSDPILPHLL